MIFFFAKSCKVINNIDNNCENDNGNRKVLKN